MQKFVCSLLEGGRLRSDYRVKVLDFDFHVLD